MTITKTADDTSIEVCDGCGRSDAGPDAPLRMATYSVHDPNTGSEVEHHYCGSCARDRGLTLTLSAVIPDWHVVMPAVVGPGETQEEHDAAMRGESRSENNGIAVQYAEQTGDAVPTPTEVPASEVPPEAEQGASSQG